MKHAGSVPDGMVVVGGVRADGSEFLRSHGRRRSTITPCVSELVAVVGATVVGGRDDTRLPCHGRPLWAPSGDPR